MKYLLLILGLSVSIKIYCLEYNIIDLGNLGGNNAFATQINELGQVTGEAELSDGSLRAFIWDNGILQMLGTLGGSFSHTSPTRCINNLGHIVGKSNKSDQITNRGFFYDGTRFWDVGTFGGKHSAATGINNLDQVVGTASTAGSKSHAFLWENGSLTDLGTLPGAIEATANAINDHGQIVGSSSGQAFLYENGIMIQLPTLGGVGGAATDINTHGQVVGLSDIGPGVKHAFIYHNGTMTDIGTLSGSNFAHAISINDLGVVVGSSNQGRAFMYQNGTMEELPMLPGATSATANGINNSGQIVGISNDEDGFFHAVLWDPLPSNIPPIADAGVNVTITTAELSGTTIIGKAMDNDENDNLECRWLAGSSDLTGWFETEPNGDCPLNLASLDLEIGEDTLTLEVRDGIDTSDDQMILVIGNSSPTAAATGSGTYEINTIINLGGEVSDFDGDILNYEWTIENIIVCSGSIPTLADGEPVSLVNCDLHNLSLGQHTALLTVSDEINNPVTKNVDILIVDNTQPILSATANHNILWPPNHKLVAIVIDANTSDNSGSVTLSATISSNEPQEGTGDGDASPDWTSPIIDQINGMITFQLRSERSGKGEGRNYSVLITAEDESGNASTTSLDVVVPHSNGKK